MRLQKAVAESYFKSSFPRHGSRPSEVGNCRPLWSTPYRFVVVRRPVREDDAGEQLTLFQMKRHHYQVLVTNLSLSPLNVWKFYNKRASIEQLIRELKGDYGIGHIPTGQYMANEAYFHLLLLAYNCVVWFQRTCLPAHLQAATLQRLREELL